MIIAIDPGSYSVKAAVVEEGRLKSVCMPTAIGPGTADIGLLDAINYDLGEVRQRRAKTPFTVTVNDISYVVGPGVERHTLPLEGIHLLHNSDTLHNRVLFYAVLAQLLPSGENSVDLLVGLPLQIMANRQKAGNVAQAIRSWLVGEHTFTVDGSEYKIRVEGARFIASTFGAFFAWGLNNSGRWIRGRRDLHGTVGILDIGFRTLAFLATQGATVVATHADDEIVGLRKAMDTIINEVKRRYDLRLTYHKTGALMTQKTPHLFCAHGDVDLTPLVKEAVEMTAKYMGDFLNRCCPTMESLKYERLLVTGGGALLLRDHIVRHLPSAILLPDPVMSNVIGLARFAERLDKRDKAARDQNAPEAS